ncbi:hypothetical protein QWZ06_15620 [Chryseobacterium tructae]|uniref:hypothetical protein n=1 Tax=Chryseobacterium tructae TaxID=1037380 RepID=UPI0025B47F72|nr:hypothetical protein [Chryseobacterium tructae]MDN3693614.1 hypothetical protein [Chryseobacterium tructae]
MISGNDFSAINVSETNAGKAPFTNSVIPRVVLFQTADGRKGAIKIKNFVTNGPNSYVVVDIKVQKQP